MKNYLLRLVVFVILLFGHPLQAEDTKDITYLRKLAATTKDSLKLMRIYSALGWELGFEDLREVLKKQIVVAWIVLWVLVMKRL